MGSQDNLAFCQIRQSAISHDVDEATMAHALRHNVELVSIAEGFHKLNESEGLWDCDEILLEDRC